MNFTTVKAILIGYSSGLGQFTQSTFTRIRSNGHGKWLMPRANTVVHRTLFGDVFTKCPNFWGRKHLAVLKAMGKAVGKRVVSWADWRVVTIPWDT